MSTIHNGGPAFPAEKYGPDQSGFDGMTLRDYFAIHSDIGDVDELSSSAGACLMGSKCPEYVVSPIGAIRWWADYEARLRYIRADAMLAARVL